MLEKGRRDKPGWRGGWKVALIDLGMTALPGEKEARKPGDEKRQRNRDNREDLTQKPGSETHLTQVGEAGAQHTRKPLSPVALSANY